MSNNATEFFTGVVEDVDDPLQLGRVRVRVIGQHSPNKSDIKTTDLPWASVLYPVTSASVSGIGSSPSGLVCGSWVMGIFRDPDFCQDLVVFGSLAGIPRIKKPGSSGFTDPNEQYPKTEFLGEADSNRLVRNENISETIVQSKKDDRTTSVSKASGGSWSEPETEYAAEYPFNKVIETESGHTIEIDDTPDKERLHIYHKSGTFIEIHPDGTIVVNTKNSSCRIISDNDNKYVGGDANENVEGSKDLKVGSSLSIDVSGNADLNIDGNANLTVGGSLSQTVEGSLTIRSSGNMTLEAPRIDLNPAPTVSIGF